MMTFLKTEWKKPLIISESSNQTNVPNINDNSVSTSEVITSVIKTFIMIEEGGSCIGQLLLRADLPKGLRYKEGGILVTPDWHRAST